MAWGVRTRSWVGGLSGGGVSRNLKMKGDELAARPDVEKNSKVMGSIVRGEQHLRLLFE